MHLGCVTSLPISRKIARERSVLFSMEAKADGLLSVRSPAGVSAAAIAGDNKAAANATRAPIWSSVVLRFAIMRAVTARQPDSSVPAPSRSLVAVLAKRALVFELVHLCLVQLVGPRQPGILPSVDGALPCLGSVLGEIAFVSVDHRIDVLEAGLGEKIGRRRAAVAGTANQYD